jgi:hypothetical protein
MYVTVSMAIPAAAGISGGPLGPPIPRSAYAVPRMDTVATTTAVIRFDHHGVSGYNGFGAGGLNVPPGPRFGLAFIVYFKRLVLLSKNNNGRRCFKKLKYTR